MFEGAHTALVTPFKDQNTFDEEAFCKIVDAQFAAGISGVVPVGTTGESPTLNHDEHKRVIELAIAQSKGKGLVIAGTGSNSTREAIALTQAAEAAGADAALLVSPYYNKPSQEGLFQHYKAIATNTKLPLMLYSIPGRCVIEIGIETVARLHEACPNIGAIKEASGSLERVSSLRAAMPKNFEILSGDDSLTIPFMSVGAVGVVSVAANIIPQVMSDLVRYAGAGNWAEAQALHAKYYELFGAFLKLDTNPVPIKAAMQIAGHIQPGIRLPMVPLTEDKMESLRQTLNDLGITQA